MIYTAVLQKNYTRSVKRSVRSKKNWSAYACGIKSKVVVLFDNCFDWRRSVVFADEPTFSSYPRSMPTLWLGTRKNWHVEIIKLRCYACTGDQVKYTDFPTITFWKCGDFEFYSLSTEKTVKCEKKIMQSRRNKENEIGEWLGKAGVRWVKLSQ